jgi:PAS domain S-box-containing protein
MRLAGNTSTAGSAVTATVAPASTRAPWLILLLCCLHFSLSAWSQELRTAREVRDLTVEQAGKAVPVRLRGVVTFFDDQLFSRFIQDATAGIYLKESTNTPLLQPGQMVEVEGVTSAGEFAPVVVPLKVTILGDQPLPEARHVTYEHLASGKEDSQFVEVVGIVRSVYLDDSVGRYVLEIATGGGRLKAYSKELPVPRADKLVDSTLRIRGVCSTAFNKQRQLFNIRLMVAHPSDLVIEKGAPADPFAIPSGSIGSLLQFTPQGTYGHRVKVFGTLTHQEPGSALYIQDESRGLFIRTRQRTPLALGDRVEVLGFPAHGDYSPVLEDAQYRRIGVSPAPTPVTLAPDEALDGTHDCQLVRIEGKLVDRAGQNHGQFLIVEAGGFLFQALLEKRDNTEAFARLENGSRVAVTGICLIEPGDWQAGQNWRARAFHILLRSASDVVVIKPPPWWSLKRLLWAIGLLACVVLGAFAWVGVLRRRVQKQTEIIGQKLQAEAALKERYEILFENANDMVFTLDLQGRFTSINSTGERLLQRSRHQLLQKSFLDVVAEDQRAAAAQWLDEALRETELPSAEWDVVNAAAQRAKLEISTRVIDRNGQPFELEGTARDITERRRLEREILEISNREQRRIGHDLHDGVCQQLASIAFRVSILEDHLQDKFAPEAVEAAEIARLINESNSQARTVARGLFPVRLEESGLTVALEELADGISSRFQIRSDFANKAPAFVVDNEAALHLYFITQEALLNAVRHGKATEVTVSIEPDGENLKLTIQDNGKGFRLAGANRTGMGIRIMRYRARVIGATLDLASQPDRGTRITCLFSPIKRSDSKA